MADDTDAIYAEIEKRKRRAQELGVGDFVWELFDCVRYYPRYVHNDPPGQARYIPPEITGAREAGHGNTVFVCDGVQYRFWWKEKNREHDYSAYSERDFDTTRTDGRLVLFVNDQRMLELKMYGEQFFGPDMPGPKEWAIRGIEAFIEGPWVEHLRKLNQRRLQHLQSVYEADAKRKRENPEKLADLKERFGLK